MLEILLSKPLQTFSLIVVLYVAWQCFTTSKERARIRARGCFAPLFPNYLPFGIDNGVRFVRAAWTHSDIEFWKYVFTFAPAHSYTVETYLAQQRFIFTADPDNIKAVLAVQFHDYGKGPQFHGQWQEFLGDSIFTTDGALWHGSRQLIRPQFVKERVKDLDTFEIHVQKVISRLGGQGEEVDIASLFYRYTLDSATDFLLGQSVGSIDSPQAEFAEAFDEVQRVQNLIGRIGKLGNLIPRHTYRQGLKKINAFVEPFIDAVLRMHTRDLKEIKYPTFLQAMAAQGVRDRKVIRDQVVAVLLAGRDTTAGALSFLFLELSRHPEIVRKLRREILEAVGTEKRPSYGDLKGMQYLKNCIQEVLRLYPSVPFNIRTALRDTTLPTGGGPNGDQAIGILEGTPVAYSTLLMQNRLDLYPTSLDVPDPRCFSPERWETWQPKPWQFIPFNGGPRICVGQQFALTEMSYTVVRILQSFDRIAGFTVDKGPRYKCEIVLSPVNGVKIGLWKAKVNTKGAEDTAPHA